MYQKKTACLIAFGTVCAALMVMIFCFSAQTADESSEVSGTVLAWITQISGAFIRSPQRQAVFVAIMQVYLRKAAHFTEYTLLGFFLTLFSAGLHRTIPGSLPLPLTLGVFYACTDEWHQTFVQERSGEPRDVLIDSAGVAFGAALACLCLLIYLRRRKKQETSR